MQELLPCPFCGAPGAKLVPGGGYWKIKCDCGITVSGYATGKKAVTAWNRRPTPLAADSACTCAKFDDGTKIFPGRTCAGCETPSR